MAVKGLKKEPTADDNIIECKDFEKFLNESLMEKQCLWIEEPEQPAKPSQNRARSLHQHEDFEVQYISLMVKERRRLGARGGATHSRRTSKQLDA
eukprot:8163653-Heterocapsa_arctica.AAC.1